jgi:hypothetical protein
MASYVLCHSRQGSHNNAVKVDKSELTEPSAQHSKKGPNLTLFSELEIKANCHLMQHFGTLGCSC